MSKCCIIISWIDRKTKEKFERGYLDGEQRTKEKESLAYGKGGT